MTSEGPHLEATCAEREGQFNMLLRNIKSMQALPARHGPPLAIEERKELEATIDGLRRALKARIELCDELRDLARRRGAELTAEIARRPPPDVLELLKLIFSDTDGAAQETIDKGGFLTFQLSRDELVLARAAARAAGLVGP